MAKPDAIEACWWVFKFMFITSSLTFCIVGLSKAEKGCAVGHLERAMVLTTIGSAILAFGFVIFDSVILHMRFSEDYANSDKLSNVSWITMAVPYVFYFCAAVYLLCETFTRLSDPRQCPAVLFAAALGYSISLIIYASFACGIGLALLFAFGVATRSYIDQCRGHPYYDVVPPVVAASETLCIDFTKARGAVKVSGKADIKRITGGAPTNTQLSLHFMQKGCALHNSPDLSLPFSVLHMHAGESVDLITSGDDKWMDIALWTPKK